ncbi:drug resistance transporter, EmrB/QacA subfamily [Alicyclobacillus hesperidum URH17-3-68]|uniref:MDR family MFS transporter n=1 Tax=Alicyclobacillus hesperidum TaxID=89784 RepID=UPI000281AAEE|nr:MDR family MFS transporter [Alicyclobacillus hesperidum]EJY57108.1 drug resistance transporter, EmrB/QacA subfamily [Alicyclobacillus hesperidum URH17-3-68]KRW91745.1 multidrug MFS transporter [Alicyclobacillus tengchongensis]GLG00245.1 MFS transporter [Alicyclobacillus hesperidum subsp. aegles]
MSQTAAAVQTTNQITGQRKWWAFATVLLTMFFSSMDQTVVSTAMPTIIGDLKGFSLYSWVFTAYMITSSITVPIYGKLSDVFGRKPFYLFGLIMFGVGSAVSGMAHTMTELVFARAFQGIGAGAMMSMPRATVGDIFSPQERAKWMGVMMAVFGISSIVGPALGGWITDSLSWRWVFYINLPFAVLAIVGVIAALPRVRSEARVQVDWLGAMVLTIGLIPMLLGFTWAGTKYAWGSAPTLALLLGGAAVLVLFVLWERKAADPLLAPSLFKNRIFSTSLILGMFVGMTMFGSLMFLPIYVQGVIGLNAQNSGWVMTPMMGGFIVGSMVSGQVMSKTGRYRYLAWLSGAVIVVGSILLNQMNLHTTWGTVMVNMVVIGLGIGSLMPLMNMAVQNAFPYKMMGTVNSTQQFVSSLAGVIASPIFGSILNKAFSHKLSESLPASLTAFKSKLAGLNPQSLLTSQAQTSIAREFNKFGAAGHHMYLQLMDAIKTSLTFGIQHLFEVGLVFAILSFIGTFFLPEVKLKGKEYFESHSAQDEESVS